MAEKKRSDLFVFGTALPPADNHGGPAHETMFLAKDEMHSLVEAIAKRSREELPVVWEHAGAEQGIALPDQHAPANKKMGRVVLGGVDGKGNLLLAAQLQWDAPETEDIRARLERGEKLGFSIGMNADRTFGHVANKVIDHVGITPVPLYGGEVAADGSATAGTWLHVATLSADGLISEIQPYLKEADMYFPADVRARYERRDEPFEPAALSLPAAEPLRSVSVGASQIVGKMSGVDTPTAPATPQPVAAAAPAPLDPALASKELQLITEEVERRFGRAPDKLTYEDYELARSLTDKYETVMKRADLGFARISPQHLVGLNKLAQYLSVYKHYTDLAIDAQEETAAGREEMRALLGKPETSRPMAKMVLASGNAIMNSHAVEAKKLRDEVEAKKTAEAKKLSEDAVALEKEAGQKRIRELEQQLADAQSKRTRVEPPAPVVAAPVIKAEAPAQVEKVSVGASRFVRAKTDRIVNENDMFWEAFSPSVNKHWASQDYYPHTLPEDDTFGMLYKRLEQKMAQNFYNAGTAMPEKIPSYQVEAAYAAAKIK